MTLQRQNPHFLRQSPARHLLHKMLPLMQLLTAVLAASALVDARTFRAGGVVTGSGRAPPPLQEHSGDIVYFLGELLSEFWCMTVLLCIKCNMVNSNRPMVMG